MPALFQRYWFNNVVDFIVDCSHSAREIYYSFIHRFVTSVNAAGSVQGDATLLSGGGVHYVDIAGAGQGVILTGGANVSGLLMDAYNNSAVNSCLIYPAVGHKIILANGTDLGANNPHTIPTKTWFRVISLDATTWLERDNRP